jgi:hypothetical protein
MYIFDVYNLYYQTFEFLRSFVLQSHRCGPLIDSINSSNPAGQILLLGNASDRVVPIAGFSPLDSGEGSGHNPSQGHSGMSSQAESFGASEVSISFGTDRLRAGAGACELICD